MRTKLPFKLLGKRILLRELKEGDEEVVLESGIVLPQGNTRKNSLNHKMEIVAIGADVELDLIIGGHLEVQPESLAIHRRTENNRPAEYFIVLEENVIGVY